MYKLERWLLKQRLVLEEPSRRCGSREGMHEHGVHTREEIAGLRGGNFDGLDLGVRDRGAVLPEAFGQMAIAVEQHAKTIALRGRERAQHRTLDFCLPCIGEELVADIGQQSFHRRLPESSCSTTHAARFPRVARNRGFGCVSVAR